MKGRMVGRGKGKDGLWALHCKKGKKGKKGGWVGGQHVAEILAPRQFVLRPVASTTSPPPASKRHPPSSPLWRVIFRLLFRVGFFPQWFCSCELRDGASCVQPCVFANDSLAILSAVTSFFGGYPNPYIQHILVRKNGASGDFYFCPQMGGGGGYPLSGRILQNGEPYYCWDVSLIRLNRGSGNAIHCFLLSSIPRSIRRTRMPPMPRISFPTPLNSD